MKKVVTTCIFLLLTALAYSQMPQQQMLDVKRVTEQIHFVERQQSQQLQPQMLKEQPPLTAEQQAELNRLKQEKLAREKKRLAKEAKKQARKEKKEQKKNVKPSTTQPR